MTNKRWEDLVKFVEESVWSFNDGASVSDEEVMVIVSVLKNNVPFDVVGEN